MLEEAALAFGGYLSTPSWLREPLLMCHTLTSFLQVLEEAALAAADGGGGAAAEVQDEDDAEVGSNMTVCHIRISSLHH